MKTCFDKSQRIDVVWSENRDEIFLKRLIDDMGKLYDAGFSRDEICKMLGCRKYVKFWSAWPSFAYPVDKLPKGYKWADGTKYKTRANGTTITYTFLAAGEDVYIKYGNGKPMMPGLNIHDKTFVKIVNFRKLTACQVLQQFKAVPTSLSDCILRFWKDDGIPLGYVVPVLHDLMSNKNTV